MPTVPQEIDSCQYLLHTGWVTAAVDIQDRPALPLTAACRAPLLREPITPGQAAELARILKALADPGRLRLVSVVAAHDRARPASATSPSRSA